MAHHLRLGVLATLFLTTAASAQETVELDPIIVSGGLTPVEAKKYGRAATVLTSEDLEARGTQYVADVLRQVPGLSVSRTGSFGGLTQVRLRGHEGNHTLVLIDGVDVAAPNQGEYDFGGLIAADIERIEVIRGPQSALYGSNAIGGVISITTKRAEEPGVSGRFGTEVGSDGTTQLDFALRARGERGELSFSAARRDTGGFDVSQTPGGGGDDDGDENKTYNLTGRLFLSDTVTIGATLRHTDRISDFDTFNFAAPTAAGLVTDSIANAEVQETFGSVFAEADLWGGRMSNRLTLSFADIDRQGRDGTGAKNQDNTGTRRKVAYQGTVALDAATLDAANHTLTFGAEWERLTYRENDPTVVFNPGQLIRQEREQTAYVLEYQGDFGNGLSTQISVRHDDNDKFRDFTTYAAGASYLLPNGTTRLHASYGTGVQNPTLIEQFGFYADFVGNPDLKPEQSEGWDIGVEQQFWDGRGIIDLTYFDETLTDEIGSRFDPVLNASVPVNNTGTSTRKGIEAAARLDVTDRLDLSLAYTWLDASEPVPGLFGGTRDAIEIRRPEHEISLGINYALPNDRTRLRLDATHVAGLYDSDFKTASFISGNPADDFDRVKLKDYTVVNLGFTHDINDRVQLNGRITNLFDENYEELEGYGTQGRTMYLGVSARF
ncbi:vitamin B12 transporter [Roseovarius pacificus]|uniref:Vitamin B12 transporter n=1 Tax=Roseovarius pacificus TaxID=337701 RepID=A0A1M7A948_9RHOB|nr:TonB-dependent receptor [Roseovarius pacificus]GGO53739.1 TonB-dependent receptor [Roseovarius pacificus]SHL39304.1 vitamin B12 transporter [Roseovarius pacificus]